MLQKTRQYGGVSMMRMGGAGARGYVRHELEVREVLVDLVHLLGVLAVPPGLALPPVRPYASARSWESALLNRWS